MTEYICKLCHYVQDPIAGVSTHNIKPYTEFKDLPDDWVCPECGADKSEFEEA